MAYNLSRNSKVFVTTNLNTATGAVSTTGLAATNCWEINVLDGFKFSQAAASTNIQIKEAGATPIRGQRAFNTALNPVDISFSTYLRPRLATGTTSADEKVLWNALMGSVGITGTSFLQAGAIVTEAAITMTVGTTITRAATTVGLCTMSNATVVGATAGTYYNIRNCVTASGAPWQGVMKLVTYTAGGVSTFEYLTPPAAAAGVTSPVLTGMIWERAAWNDMPTHAQQATPYGQVTSAASNKNQLLPIGFIFIVDGATYTVDNCAMDSATVDFGLDAIAMSAWTAKGTKLNQLATNATYSAGTFGGGLTGSATTAVATAQYITNKLSTVTLQSNLFGRTEGSASTAYTIVLTGGSIQYQNNCTYVTPNNIGTVNLPIGYFTGTRAVSGTLNAYLRTGTGYAADLLSSLLTTIAAGGSAAAETKYRLQVEVGGAANVTRVEFEMPGVVIGIPSVDIADVVSTSITFNGQGASSGTNAAFGSYDIENTNDLAIRYYSA